jgi:two-component system sensor histidine kinase RegB
MTQIEPRGMTAPSIPAAGWPAIAAKRRPMTLEGWDSSESRLRLQTLTRLRWVAVGGQLATVLAVHFVLGFDLPLLLCLTVIGFSALLNIVMQARFPASKRLQSGHAVLTLAYDLVQLSVLLYLTGGLQNPFSLLMVVPAAISASTQPSRITVGLCALSVLCATLLMIFYMPLPWLAGSTLTLPFHYMMGVWTSLVSCIIFMAVYAWRTTQENRQMLDALAATERRLAREQKLSALDGLAAAAAHELGTPLSTISLVAKELEREIPEDSPLREDIVLLRTQATRCRDILRTLTQHSGESDAMFSRMSLGHLIEEVVQPFRSFGISIDVVMKPAADAPLPPPVLPRNPGVIYGLTNLVENAVDFASSRVEITAFWDAVQIRLSIADDGPGFAPNVLGRLGDPFVTTRAHEDVGDSEEAQGMGLGIFIAKTLLERTRAAVKLRNCAPPDTGACIEVVWKRAEFEAA